MSLRSFQPDDLQTLIKLYRQCFEEAPWYERFAYADVKKMFERVIYEWPDGQMVVAANNRSNVAYGAALGFHLCRKEEILSRIPKAYQNAFYIAELFVSPEQRKKGSCKKMACQLLKELQSCGYQRIVVRTSVDQPAVHKLFGCRGSSHEFATLAFQQVMSQKVIGDQTKTVADQRIILGGTIEEFFHRVNGTDRWRR